MMRMKMRKPRTAPTEAPAISPVSVSCSVRQKVRGGGGLKGFLKTKAGQVEGKAGQIEGYKGFPRNTGREDRGM